MRMKLYHILVNRHSGIKSRYHKLHDQGGIRRLVSYFYLIFLNFCYYCLFCRFLDEEKQMEPYEEKRLPECPESALFSGEKLTVDGFVDTLSQYDVISFDIFDTLIFRPFSEPTDLFYFLGDRIGLMDVKRIRMEQEVLARRDCFRKKGHYEVTFEDIWKRMECEMGIPAKKGMELEQELEMKFCYANPFMLQVFEGLRHKGKKIICISDMYLPRVFLDKLLEKNGYVGIDRLYVSCEYGKNKGNGELYKTVKGDFPEGVRFIHVGDNEQSDVKMAKKHGFAALHYPNVNRQSLSLRPYDMSPVIGGAYRGIINNHLYQGGTTYSMEYEYGFVYGGLFVLGYCHFIHEYCHNHKVEKLLFLSRDGDVLKEVYNRLYPEDSTAYVYWSRGAATKLMAEYDRYDYFRRFLFHKVNQGISVGEVLDAMGLQKLLKLFSNSESRCSVPETDNSAGFPLTDTKPAADGSKESGNARTVLHLSDKLTDKNVYILKEFLQAHYAEVCSVYRKGQEAAKAYYENALSGIGHAAAVDIGWAGSGAISLAYLVERVWKLPCQITGILAGTNTIHNREPDAGEMFLQSGKMVSYLFSQSHNRDVMKKHDPDRDYNVYWELLLSSPERKFLGFSFEEGMPSGVCSEEGREVKLLFGEQDANQEGIQEIRRGVLDFVSDYVEHFKEEPSLIRISGRDACAPMLAAAGHGEKYLKMIAGRFALEKGV